MRKEQAKKGKRIAYDRRCASLTNDQIEENLAMGMPFTVRLKVHYTHKVTVNMDAL